MNRRTFLKQSGLLSVAVSVYPLSSCQSISAPMTFGLSTDSHYADREPKGTRYYRQSLDKMKEFVEVMTQENADFIINLGDFKDEHPSKKPQDTLHFLDEIEGVFASFAGPRYHCVGNHDVDSITKQQFLSQIDNTGIPPGKSYYGFDQGGIHFVVLDATYDKEGNDHFYAEGSDWQDPNIPAEQLAWLRSDLAATSLPTIVFCHHPLFEYRRDGYQFHATNYRDVQQVLEASGKVLAVFQGHVHEEKHQKIGGIHYLTQLGMVDQEGLANNSFALVSVDSQAISVRGYKRTSDQSFKR